MQLSWEKLTLSFSRISMFPFFDIAHYLVCMMTMRQQLEAIPGEGQNPLINWFRAMLRCFGGGILSSILLGEAPAQFLENNTNVLLASSIWYIVFYCPYDIVCEFYGFPPIQVLAVGMQEMSRTWKIIGGITYASRNYTDAWLVLIAVGWTRGAGGNVILKMDLLLRGAWKPETSSFQCTSYPMKISLVGAVLFTLQHIEKLPIEKHSLMFCYTFLSVVTKITMILTESKSSPFTPFEIILGRMLFGCQQQEATTSLRNTLKSSLNGASSSTKPCSTSTENKKRHCKKME